MSWTSETNIKGPAGPAGGISEAPADGQTYGRKNTAWSAVTSGGGGAASGITVTPAGNIASTNVQAALQELDSEKVAKAGDVMTGNLQIGKTNPALVLQKTASGQSDQIAAYNGANPRWAMILGDVTAESGGNAGSDFALYRYTDAGGFIDAPLTVKRSDGGITLTGALLLAADPGAALGAATKQYVDNNVRAPATALPLVESGAGAVGTSVKFAREDHVHPLGPGGGGVVISDTPPASPTAGMLWWQSNTGLFFLYYNDGNSSQWVALPGGNVNPVQRSHLAGLTLSTPGASASFTVQPGVAADSTNIAMMTLPAAITKTMGAWVVGSGNGALDTGTIAANYHDVYLIRRPDTGVVDVLLTIMGNAPTLPANYTQFRRIGSLNNGLNVNQWLKFTQTGDEFLWDAPIQDLNAQAVGTTGFFATAIAPPNCEAILYAVMVSNTAITLATIHSLVANAALIVNNPVIGNYQFCTPIANVPATATNLRVRLNASRQYRIVSNASAATCQFSIATLGYIDRRGRDA